MAESHDIIVAEEILNDIIQKNKSAGPERYSRNRSPFWLLPKAKLWKEAALDHRLSNHFDMMDFYKIIKWYPLNEHFQFGGSTRKNILSSSLWSWSLNLETASEYLKRNLLTNLLWWKLLQLLTDKRLGDELRSMWSLKLRVHFRYLEDFL